LDITCSGDPGLPHAGPAARQRSDLSQFGACKAILEDAEAAAYFGPKFSVAGFVLGASELTSVSSDQPDVPGFDV